MNYDINYLLSLLSMSDEELIAHLLLVLPTYYDIEDIATDQDNYIYCYGKSTMCLVAHMDTKRENNKMKLRNTNGIIDNKYGILGADDRAGVFGILVLLQTLPKEALPFVLFTNYEENLGVGVEVFCKENIFDHDKINLMIELDREGCNQYVTYYYTMPKQLERYVESFGYVEEIGSYSDVADLTSEYEIPHINVSVGYHHQHTIKEELHLDELELSLKRVHRMLLNPYKVHHTTPSMYVPHNVYGGKYKGVGAVTYYSPKTFTNSYLRTKYNTLKEIFVKNWTITSEHNYSFTASELKLLDDVCTLAYSMMDEGYEAGYAFENAWDALINNEV